MAKPKISSQTSTRKKSKASSAAKGGRPAASAPSQEATGADSTVSEATGAVATAITAPNKLPAATAISIKSLATVWKNRRLFLGIIGIQSLLVILFARGLSGSSDLTQLEQILSVVDGVSANFALYAYLLTGGGENPGDASSAYQVFFYLISSLAIVWALRQVMAGSAVRIRDSFYKGMYPLVPVVIVMSVMVLALLPLFLTAILYDFLMDIGVAATILERVLWALVMVVGAAASLYFLASTVMALYIATLPDMTPMAAFRSARELVRGRRLSVIRKILFFPIVAAFVFSAIMLVVISLSTAAAPWVFFGLSMVGLAIMHAYFYTLYRELLL
jgi:hypothetical protein